MKFLQSPRDKTIALILLTGLVRLYIAAFTGLGVGESYYWRGTQFLDWSYFDQPPLFFWLSALSTKLVGLSNFGLRLPAVLLFAGSSWLLFLLTKKLFDEKSGFYAILLLNVSIVFTVPIAAWFQPDAPLIFFWLLTSYLLINVLFNNEPKSILPWIGIGLSLGLTALSKYHALFLIASTFLFVLVNKERRKWLMHPGPYLALIIALLCLFPVFYWNSQHEWVSFNFQGGRAGGREINLARLGRSLIGQVGWLAPWIWLPLIIQLFKAGKSTDDRHSFLFWCAVLPIAFFTAIALVSRIGFHFHWQAPGYLMLFPLLGVMATRRLETGSILIKRWIRGSVLFTVITSLALIIHMTTGFWSVAGPKVVGSWFGNTTDPTIEGIDFYQIKERFKQEGWLEDENIFVASEKWWQTGKIDWPLKGEKDIITFHRDPRNHAYFFDPKKLLGKDAIYVRYHKEHGEPTSHLTPFFKQVRALDPILIGRGESVDLKLDVFYCEEFIIPTEPQEHLPVYRLLQNQAPF